MKKFLVLIFLCAFLAAWGANPVRVSKDGLGDFDTIQAAIDSWCITGGSNAGETPPFIINIDPGYIYDEPLSLSMTDGKDLAGDIVIQSENDELAHVRLQKAPDAVDDGLDIKLFDQDVTLRKLLIYPSLTGTVILDEVVKIDGIANADFHVLIEDCIITDANTDGDPLTTTREGAYIEPVNYSTARTNGFPSLIQIWGDATEKIDLTLRRSVLYGNMCRDTNHDGASLRLVYTESDQTFIIEDSVISYGRSHMIRVSSSAGLTGVKFIMDGTDQTAGLDQSNVLINNGGLGTSHCLWFSGTAAVNEISIKKTIFIRDDGGSSRGISGGSPFTITAIEDSIFYTSDVAIVDNFTTDYTIARCTFQSTNATNAFLSTAGASTGTVNFVDCIFSGPGTKMGLESGTASVSYSAFVGEGPDAIGATGTYVDAGNNINNDPRYLSYDFASPDFLDVTNPAFIDKNSVGGALTGGANENIGVYYLAGSFGALLGGADWNPAHPELALYDYNVDGIYTLTVTLPSDITAIAPGAGWKITDGTWDWSFTQNGNLSFIGVEDEVVTFAIDTNAQGDGFLPDSHFAYSSNGSEFSAQAVNFVGDLPGAFWNNNNSEMVPTLSYPETEYLYVNATATETKTVAWKICASGEWDSYQLVPDNQEIAVEEGDVINFILDPTKNRVKATLNDPLHVEDWSIYEY